MQYVDRSEDLGNGMQLSYSSVRLNTASSDSHKMHAGEMKFICSYNVYCLQMLREVIEWIQLTVLFFLIGVCHL